MTPEERNKFYEKICRILGKRASSVKKVKKVKEDLYCWRWLVANSEFCVYLHGNDASEIGLVLFNQKILYSKLERDTSVEVVIKEAEIFAADHALRSVPMRFKGKYSDGHRAFRRHIGEYHAYKRTHPQLALAELKKAVSIQYEDHPKSDEYLTLLFAVDAAGEATLLETLALNKLILEMVVDNGFSDEVTELQREWVETDAQRIKALKAQGKNPNQQYFRFILRNDTSGQIYGDLEIAERLVENSELLKKIIKTRHVFDTRR